MSQSAGLRSSGKLLSHFLIMSLQLIVLGDIATFATLDENAGVKLLQSVN